MENSSKLLFVFHFLSCLAGSRAQRKCNQRIHRKPAAQTGAGCVQVSKVLQHQAWQSAPLQVEQGSRNLLLSSHWDLSSPPVCLSLHHVSCISHLFVCFTFVKAACATFPCRLCSLIKGIPSVAVCVSPGNPGMKSAKNTRVIEFQSML